MSAPGRASRLWLVILLLLTLRAVVAGLLPLSADEAYYWLWSKHLDVGYLDHPPAIAWIIRLGTALLGDIPFGVRLGGVLLSGAATWLMWETARLLFKDDGSALYATLLFNLTLMVNVEMLAATPDMPSIVTGLAFFYSLAKLQESGRGEYWLWAGLAAGLGLLSKYSALFLIAGAFLWLLISPKMRIWLKTPWPWAGAALALLVFLPNLWWQSSHHWETFAFQFSRVAGHQLTLRFILEFLGAQLGLASPFIFILGVAGLAGARRDSPLFLPAMLVWPAIAYFFVHALHDRVQGNWPSFVYPAFCILAVAAVSSAGWRKWSASAAAPVAAVFLLTVYFQALTGLIPLGARDPLPRLLGVGVPQLAGSLERMTQQHLAAAIVTTDYESTAWLRFYAPSLKVIQLDEEYRYPKSPPPDPVLARGPLLYVVEKRRDQNSEVKKYFSSVRLASELQVGCRGCRQDQALARYEIYLAEQEKAPLPGRMP